MALQQLPRQHQRVVAPAQSGLPENTCLGCESLHEVFTVVPPFQTTSEPTPIGASSDSCVPRRAVPLAHLDWGDPSVRSIRSNSSAAPEQETPL
jgi:hypothetical protein